MNLYYWCPFLSKVATVDAVIQSLISLKKHSRKINPILINVVGEWNNYSKILKRNKIKIFNLSENKFLYKKLPRYGFINSRISYLIISTLSFYRLLKFLQKRNENDYIMFHLITSLPLILINMFNFKCKFILRISGFPRLHVFRKYLWKISAKKLYKVFSPTRDTYLNLIKKKIFEKKKIRFLRDPIVDLKKINRCKYSNKLLSINKNFIVSTGRLTNQKNHSFLIDGFYLLKKKYTNLRLIIIGEGELKKELSSKIFRLGLRKCVKLIGYKKNVYKYYRNALCFCLTSKWEDPGFVLIEAAAAKIPIISSDCKNGPKEFINKNQRGYLYKNYSLQSFVRTFYKFFNDQKKNRILKAKISKAYEESKKYTKKKHQKDLERYLKHY